MSIEFPHNIFREYDIRGIADDEITVEFAYDLAVAYAQMLPQHIKQTIVVARDVRLSGLKLQQAVMQGLCDRGVDVLDIGMVPTPLAYYAVYEQPADGCIMVTASHNPAAYNGFKMMLGDESFHGQAIQQLKGLMLAKQGVKAAEKGVVKQLDVVPDYHDFVVRDCTLERPLKVVIDAGNGPSGVIAAPIYRGLQCEVIELYCEPDGRFPNHHPDPTIEENMRCLSKKVVESQADLGIAFDGDGDRIGVVDEQGKMLWGDMLLLLLSRQLLKQYPQATIISEVKSSQTLYDDIRQHGGKAVMCRTGHSPIKGKMKETGALLAGEMSGHFFFADRFFGFDDAVYAGARVMQLLAEQTGVLSGLLSGVPQLVNTQEIRMDCAEDRKFAVVEAAKEHFSALGYTLITIDGMRLVTDDGWALLRASNTQAALVMRYEACDKQALCAMQEMLEAWLQQAMES
ncbi:MAG: phosphomannomutase/phosphoglucomutase [Ghiorsea sp.]